MPQHSVQFEPTLGGLELTNAILLYQGAVQHDGDRVGGRSGGAFASIHAIEEQAGRPMIAAGAPLSRAHLRQWAEVLGTNAPPEILPENVLVAHPDMLAWWVPEQIRPAYFKLTKPPAGAKALDKRTTLPMPYPAHLFVAVRSNLRVFALPESRRPAPETVLLHSPVLNVYLDGSLCWGNIRRPKAAGVAAIPEYESAVFDSWSTHANPGQELTVTGKGGLVRLWDDLAARGATRFPVKRLKPFNPSEQRRTGAAPVTLAKLIAGAARA